MQLAVSEMEKGFSKKLHLEMNKFVFGPLFSRRLGISLGVNPLPKNKKSCTFNCVYCQLGKTDNPLTSPSCLKNYPRDREILEEFDKVLGNIYRI